MRNAGLLVLLTTVVVIGSVLVLAAPARAQEGDLHYEVGLQGTGFFTKNSQGNGISQNATDSGGFLVGYRYYFHRWLAAEANYGYARNTQNNFTATGAFGIQANVHEATAALVVTPRVSAFRLRPYALAGSGALVFDPTGNVGGVVPGAQRQAKAVFVYGGGADYPVINHVFLRAEYRGFVYKRPGFGFGALNSDATAYTAQPSAGIVFRF